MKISHVVLASVLLLGAPAAFACTGIKNLSGVDEATKSQLLIQCEQTMLAQKEGANNANKLSEVITKDKMQEISEIAKVAGQTVKEVATELNVAVNDFIKTPVGMLTAGLAIWYVTGDSITSLISQLWSIPAGIVMLIVLLVLAKKILSRIWTKEYKEVTVKGWFGTEKVKRVPVYMTYKEVDDNFVILNIVVILATLTISSIIVTKMIV